MTTDSDYMEMALGLARRVSGVTWPNPSVGCVIVDPAGHVIGRGHTGMGGRPHAETVALAQAGSAAAGSTAYVTLEPCAHHGQTPPCADALVKAKVARVVVAIGDPDDRVAGKGIALLQQANIQVDLGIGRDEAAKINQGFFKVCAQKGPLVTVKIATSLDGRIATASGDSKWITGDDSRRRGHLLRAEHDAIMVGIGTVIADDPSLDCRISGLEDRSPVRIVIDSQLKIPEKSKLVTTARKIPTWIMTTQSEGQKAEKLKRLGVDVIQCDKNNEGRVDFNKMMKILGQKGITRLLSEGGAQVNASLMRASLIDRLYWFQSSGIIGADGLPAFQSIGLDKISEMVDFSLVRTGKTGQDIWQEFKIGH